MAQTKRKRERRLREPLTVALETWQQSDLLARAMNIAEGRRGLCPEDEPWTVEMVLHVALANGLDEMERRYCRG